MRVIGRDSTARQAVAWLLSMAMLAVLFVAAPARAERGHPLRSQEVHMADCDEQFVVRAVDAADLDVALPDDFTLRNDFRLGEGVAEVGTFSIEFDLGGSTVREIYEMLAVHAPAGEAIGRSDWILLSGTTTRPADWVRWVQWCFVGAMASGRIDHSVVVDDGRRVGEVEVDSRRGDLRLTTSVPAEGDEAPAGSAGLFALRNGEVVGRALWEWSEALLSLGAGSYAQAGEPADSVAFGGHSFGSGDRELRFTFTGLTSVRGGCSR